LKGGRGQVSLKSGRRKLPGAPRPATDLGGRSRGLRRDAAREGAAPYPTSLTGPLAQEEPTDIRERGAVSAQQSWDSPTDDAYSQLCWEGPKDRRGRLHTRRPTGRNKNFVIARSRARMRTTPCLKKLKGGAPPAAYLWAEALPRFGVPLKRSRIWAECWRRWLLSGLLRSPRLRLPGVTRWREVKGCGAEYPTDTGGEGRCL
jgi:hypothetical protein